MKNVLKIIAVLSLFAGISSCYYDNPPDLIPFECSEVSYSTHVMPIWARSCATAGCHDGSHEPNLTSEVGWTELVNLGYVNTGIPEQSLIYGEVNSGSMPPGGPKLSDLDLQLILCWLEEGAKND